MRKLAILIISSLGAAPAFGGGVIGGGGTGITLDSDVRPLDKGELEALTFHGIMLPEHLKEELQRSDQHPLDEAAASSESTFSKK